MIDPEREEYEKWYKTRKEILPEIFAWGMDGKEITIPIRNCEQKIKVGEVFGGAEILKIEAYGKSLDYVGEGITCLITFSRMPGFTIVESEPSFARWVKENKK
jgi:hypothetical protein